MYKAYIRMNNKVMTKYAKKLKRVEMAMAHSESSDSSPRNRSQMTRHLD